MSLRSSRELDRQQLQTHFCRIWPVKEKLRYNTRPMTEQGCDCDTKRLCLADLTDGLLSGVWASGCATVGECAATTVEIKNSERPVKITCTGRHHPCRRLKASAAAPAEPIGQPTFAAQASDVSDKGPGSTNSFDTAKLSVSYALEQWRWHCRSASLDLW